MSIITGVTGGATAAIIYRAMEELLGSKAPPRPVRRYRGYPSDTADVYYTGAQEVTIGPPQGWGWEILAALLYIDTDANVATRIPTIYIQRRSDGAMVLPVILSPFEAGEVGFVYFMQGAALPEYAIGGFIGMVYPLPLNGELKDETLRVFIDGGLAGDAWRLFIYYEEFET